LTWVSLGEGPLKAVGEKRKGHGQHKLYKALQVLCILGKIRNKKVCK